MRDICLWCLLNRAVTKKGFYNQLKWPSGENVRLGSCRLGFDSIRVKPMTLILVFTASLLDA